MANIKSKLPFTAYNETDDENQQNYRTLTQELAIDDETLTSEFNCSLIKYSKIEIFNNQLLNKCHNQNCIKTHIRLIEQTSKSVNMK